MLYKDLIFIGLFIIILSILIFAIYYIKKQFDYYNNKILEINNNIFKIVSLPNQQIETINNIPLINNDNLETKENNDININSLKQENKIINDSHQNTKDLIKSENSLNQTDNLESKETNNDEKQTETNNEIKIKNDDNLSFSCLKENENIINNISPSKEDENNKLFTLPIDETNKEVEDENQNIENDIIENQNILMSFLNNVISNIENQVDIIETPKVEDTENNKVFIIDENTDSNSQTPIKTIPEDLNISHFSTSENKEITEENLKIYNKNIDSSTKENKNFINNNVSSSNEKDKEKNNNLKESESDEMIKLLNNDHKELKNKYKNILSQDLKNIKLQELKNIAKFLNIPLTKQINKYRKEELYNMCLNQLKD